MRHDPAGTKPRNGRYRSSKARFSLAVASGLAVLAAAGCSASNAAGGGSVSGTITIAAVPGIDNAPLYLALHDGMFAAAGLHVVIRKESQESSEFSALQSKQVQIAAADYGSIFNAQSQSGGYRILADGFDATAGSVEVMTLPNSPIKSPDGLSGKKIAVPVDDVLTNEPQGFPVSLEAAAASQVLSTDLGNPSAPNGVTWDPMPEASELTALEHHQVQAILLGQPYIFEAEQAAGAVEVMDACSDSTANLPLSGYVATSQWVKQNPTAVADFRSAIAAAQSEASMTGPVQKILPTYTGDMSKQVADLATIGSYPTTTSATELGRVASLLELKDMIKTLQVPPMIVR